jgi:uncharacterized protein (DUF1697 family)
MTTAYIALLRAINLPNTRRCRWRGCAKRSPRSASRTCVRCCRPTALIEKTLGTRVTARNWNTVRKLAAALG